MSSLLELVRSNKVSSPIQKKFSIEKWEKGLEDSDQTEKDYDLYKTGLVFNELLVNIRQEIEKLYKKFNHKISSLELIRYYISSSNRNNYLMQRDFTLESSQNLYGLTDIAVPLDNQFTLDELDVMSIDGVMPAIKHNLSNLNEQNSIKKNPSNLNKHKSIKNNKLSIPHFILNEIFLSQQYVAIESYWNSIIWSNYSFSIDIENQCYQIVQPNNLEQKLIANSYIRYNRINYPNTWFKKDFTCLNLEEFSKLCICAISANKFLFYNKKSNEISIKELTSIDEKYKSKLLIWISQYLHEMDIYGPFLSKQIKNKYRFSIKNILDVYFQLICLASSINDGYPQKDSIDLNKIKKLHLFSPLIKKNLLIQKLVLCLGLDGTKIMEILDFLTINEDNKTKDLWCYPLFLFSNNRYILSTASLCAPLLSRLLEHWLDKLIPEEKNKKGEYYEKMVIDGIYKKIKDQELLTDKEFPRQITISIDEIREEIDFIMRIGSIILLGELKCNHKSDSPISEYNNLAILKKGVEQATRKAEFIKNNLSKVFKQLNWKYEVNNDYKIVKFVLNYSKMYSGMTINDVPICDNSILQAYFSDGKIPLIIHKNKKGTIEHLVSAVIYEDFFTFQENLEKYLTYPPQIYFSMPKFKYDVVKFPISANYFKTIEYQRLVVEDPILNRQVNQYNHFPLEIKGNIDKLEHKFLLL